MEKKELVKASKISNINIKNVTIATSKKNKTVPIFYKECNSTFGKQNKSLIFQTPFLEVMDPVQDTRLSGINQFVTCFPSKPHIKKNHFFNFIENLETYIIDLVDKTEESWFAEKNVTMTPLIRETTDTCINYIKWPFYNTSCLFIDEKKQPFNFENIRKKDSVKLIVEISNLWIDKNQFGLEINIQKVMVRPHLEKIQSEYIFDEDSSSESEEANNKMSQLFATDQKSKNSKSIKHNSNLLFAEADNKKSTQLPTNTIREQHPEGVPNKKSNLETKPKATFVPEKNSKLQQVSVKRSVPEISHAVTNDKKQIVNKLVPKLISKKEVFVVNDDHRNNSKNKPKVHISSSTSSEGLFRDDDFQNQNGYDLSSDYDNLDDTD